MNRMRLKRKRKSRKFYKILLFILFFGLACKYTLDIITHYQLDVSNEEFINMILDDASYLEKYERNSNNLFDKTLTFLTDLNIHEPIEILKTFMHYDYVEEVFQEEEPEEIIITEKSKVYIYNTHQLEKYSTEDYENYDITPNVLMASYILQDKLKDYNIDTVVEERSVSDLLNSNGWDYNASYKASRYFLEDTLAEDEFDLIIDLHRDALSKSASTTEINGKSYAKVLFVVGVDHDNYKVNLELAKTLNNLIISSYPTLSRGVITKGGSGVNGIYNQDVASNIILLEVGGQHNKVSEVMNTLEAVAEIIHTYLGET